MAIGRRKQAMKVYVVYCVGCGGHAYVEGIYNTPDKAEAVRREMRENDITSWWDEVEVQ